MSAAQRVGDLLEHYAGRGVFRGFGRQAQRGRSAEFRLRSKSGEWVWFANYGRIMDGHSDTPGKRLIGDVRFP